MPFRGIDLAPQGLSGSVRRTLIHSFSHLFCRAPTVCQVSGTRWGFGGNRRQSLLRRPAARSERQTVGEKRLGLWWGVAGRLAGSVAAGSRGGLAGRAPSAGLLSRLPAVWP